MLCLIFIFCCYLRWVCKLFVHLVFCVVMVQGDSVSKKQSPNMLSTTLFFCCFGCLKVRDSRGIPLVHFCVGPHFQTIFLVVKFFFLLGCGQGVYVMSNNLWIIEQARHTELQVERGRQGGQGNGNWYQNGQYGQYGSNYNTQQNMYSVRITKSAFRECRLVDSRFQGDGVPIDMFGDECVEVLCCFHNVIGFDVSYKTVAQH